MTKSPGNDNPWLIVGLADVVTTSVPAARLEALAEAAALGPADVHDRLWGSGFVGRCSVGDVSLAEMLDGIRERLAVDLTEAHLMGLWSLAYEPDLEAIAALTAATGLRPGVVVDETPLFRAAFEAYMPEVELLVEGSWFSFEHAALTDDARFYRSVAQETQMSGAQPVFVGSTVVQSQAAAAADWRVAPDLRGALRDLDHGRS